MTLKKGFCLQVFVIRFISQWIKRSKRGLHVFPPKKKCNMKKALFDWPIVLQYKVKAKYGLISGKFFERKVFQPNVRLTNQKPHAFVSVRQTNQITLFPFVCFFCFVCRFSFQGYTKFAVTAHLNIIWIECLSLCSSRSAYDYSMHS